MKGLLALLAAAALAVAAWLYVAVEVAPKIEAKDFVEEIRIGMDGEKAGNYSRYTGPKGLPSDAWTRPRYGVGEPIVFEKAEKGRFFDPPESRTIVWKVTFPPSPLFEAPRNAKKETYRLVMVDSGTRLLPSFRIVEFHPWNDRRRRR